MTHSLDAGSSTGLNQRDVMALRAYLSNLVILAACATHIAAHGASPIVASHMDSPSVAQGLHGFPAKPDDLDQSSWTALEKAAARAVPTTTTKLTASDAAVGNDFGWSVALSGTTALVGAYTKNDYQGVVYVFTFNGSSWVQQQELTGSDGAATDGFGYSVALSGTTALVGAYQKNIGSSLYQGAVYVFTFNGSTWVQQQELVASDGVTNDEFGTSVALSGNTALVGAADEPLDTFYSSTYPGKAYTFTFSAGTWTQQQVLTASDGVVGDLFGCSVALSGTTALVGAFFKKIGSNSYQGAAYVFTFNGSAWIQQQRLTSSDGASYDEFGNSVALSGTTALVGAEAKAIGSNGAQGAAYLFTLNNTTWVQQQELTASDGSATAEFGASVALSGNTALVGASNATTGVSGIYYGAAYVFNLDETSWVQVQKLTPSDPVTASSFGIAVALSGSTALVGASGPFEGSSDTYAGAAYVFAPVGDSIFCGNFDGGGQCN